MITIILFVLLSVFVSIWSVWDEFSLRYRDLIIGNIFQTIFIALVFALIGLIVAYILPMETTTKIDTYNIVCLQDNSSPSGGFLLGTGFIQGDMKYVFYYEENGVYRIKQTNYDNTSVKYSDDIKVERYRQEPVKSFINYFALDNTWSEDYMQFIIYVPEGTINNNYSLDAL